MAFRKVRRSFALLVYLCSILLIYYWYGVYTESIRYRVTSDSWHIPSRFFILKETAPVRQRNVSAAMVILIRERELEDMVKTLEIFERRFNHRFKYPYVFLNEEVFSDKFKEGIRGAIKSGADVRFGQVPKEHWSYPEWIDQKAAAQARENLKHVIYGDSESYRFMCRYQSGFFFRHPLLDDIDYYWRLEPGTKLLCDVPYDPFEYMDAQGIKYGFNINIQEIRETIPTLWQTVMDYVNERREREPWYNPEMLNFFNGYHDYNTCHFWSNFELGSIKWLRSPEYLALFDRLDRSGGFFMERWGDAPVHSLAVGALLNRTEVHYFGDIGYIHPPFHHCPSMPLYEQRNCDCDMWGSMDLSKYSCMPAWLSYSPSQYFN